MFLIISRNEDEGELTWMQRQPHISFGMIKVKFFMLRMIGAKLVQGNTEEEIISRVQIP